MTLRAPSGVAKHYFATDRLRDPGYRKIGLENFLAGAAEAGLGWDAVLQTGVVVHMMRSLGEQGRVGVTAIADTPDQARELYLHAVHLLERLADEPAVTAGTL